MKRIFLIGYMGAGKTTVGRVLAQRMELSFIDLDCYIENRYQKSIGQLFTEKGENGFREIERNLLHEVSEFENVLVSTGGGAPCFFDNITFMKGKGTVVYLKVSVNELVKRLETCKQSRPLLKDKTKDELNDFISQTLKKREVYYLQASLTLDAEKMYDDTDVQKIVIDLEKIV